MPTMAEETRERRIRFCLFMAGNSASVRDKWVLLNMVKLPADNFNR